MKPSTRWTDIVAIVASLFVIGASAAWLIGSGTFGFALDQDAKLVWHLVRSSGVVAYVLLLASTVWGLFISSQLIGDWSPGPVSMTLHTTVSWLALLLGLGHGLLLMFDDYFAYTLLDVLVPFIGPYRPEVVGLGTLAFWSMLAISLSFPLKKRIGHSMWQRLHYVSYAAFGMVSVHGLLAGTDGERPGFRLLIALGVLVVVLLLGVRLGKDQAKPARQSARPQPKAARES